MAIHTSVIGVATALLGLFGQLQLALADPSYACAEGFPKPVEWDAKPREIRVFRVNDRTIRVTLPVEYKKDVPAPLILAYHDKDAGPERMEYETALYDEKVNKDAVVVYPLAENERWMSDITPLSKPFVPPAENETNDIIFTKLLLRDLENLLCIDTSRIYATGLGTGGGMMHLLACDSYLSTRITAFAAVAAGFGVPSRKDKDSPWNQCKPRRRPIPVLEIHGGEDRIFGYWLKEGENGKTRRIPPHWIEEWAERNGCGDAVGDAVQSETNQGTFITKLEYGLMSEAAVNAGAVMKIARSCKATGDDDPLEDPKPKDVSVLHYKLKRYGHGWPRLQLKKEEEVIIQGTQVKPTGDVYFDTTKTILDFFSTHRLPARLAKRKPITGMPGDDDVDDQLRELKESYIARAEMEKKAKEKAEAEEDEEDENAASDRDEL